MKGQGLRCVLKKPIQLLKASGTLDGDANSNKRRARMCVGCTASEAAYVKLRKMIDICALGMVSGRWHGQAGCLSQHSPRVPRWIQSSDGPLNTAARVESDASRSVVRLHRPSFLPSPPLLCGACAVRCPCLFVGFVRREIERNGRSGAGRQRQGQRTEGRKGKQQEICTRSAHVSARRALVRSSRAAPLTSRASARSVGTERDSSRSAF